MLASQYGNPHMLGSNRTVSCAEAYSAVCKQVNYFDGGLYLTVDSEI